MLPRLSRPTPQRATGRRSTVPRPTPPRRRAPRPALLAAVALALLAAAPPARNVPGLAAFAPSGTATRVTQVRATFATPMVALGDPRSGQPPFTIDCPVTGDATWADSRTWLYDFARELPAGVRCTFTTRPGLADVTGATLPSGEQRFDTGGPAIRFTDPSEGERIAEDQAFVLTLDGPADPASVLAHASFAVDGIADRVGLRFVEGAERDAILKAAGDRPSDAGTLVVAAAQRFPAGVAVRLVWGAGIAAPSGLATTAEQTLAYETRPAFAAEVRCDHEGTATSCIPIAPIDVLFTAPVRTDVLRDAALVAPDGRRFTPVAPGEPQDDVTVLRFRDVFPPASTLRLELPADLRDDAGRPLADSVQLPITIATGPVPPLAKFPSRFGILEAHADPAVPVTVRRLPAVAGARLSLPPVAGTAVRIPTDDLPSALRWLRQLAQARRERSVLRGRPLPAGVERFSLPVTDERRTTEVVGIPLPRPGLWIVELESKVLGQALLAQDRPMYVPTAAWVTNLAVHLKWGTAGSVVWVTRLDDGRPAANAEVTVADCAGRTLWRGSTDGDGLARPDRLPDASTLRSCWESSSDDEEEPDPFRDWQATRALSALDAGLIATARLGDDVGLVSSGWDDGLEPYRWNLPTEGPWSLTRAHTIFARTLLRAGETAHMKHVLRARTPGGFGLPPRAEWPAKVVIRHVAGEARTELPLAWRDDGTAESTWEIPRDALLGTWDVVLATPGDPRATPPRYGRELEAGSLRVEEFRVPATRASVRLPAEPQVRPAGVGVDLAVQYLAGGPAANLPVTVRSLVRPGGVALPDDLEGFEMANGPVETGLVRRGEEEAPESTPTPPVHQRTDVRLDAAGTAHVDVTDLAPPAQVQELVAEAEYRDPSGRIQTARATVPLWPARWVVGIKAESRFPARPRLALQALVLDAAGKPVANAPVRLEAFRRVVYTHRTRLVGGFYAYETVAETTRTKKLCRGTTDARGLVACDVRAPRGGQLLVQATVLAPGGAASANVDVWVPGEDTGFDDVGDDWRMDLLPERKRLEPGETARLQVRMPFQRATALVTLEREGVLQASVRELAGTEPVVELPMAGSYAPNVFVSVLAVRGRAADVQPTALVDLGKPTFRLGFAELEVGWREHRLDVTVHADREVYRVREQARVEIQARTADGGPPPAGTSVALAAVDEGLLELMPNRSWTLLDAFMGRRGTLVRTASAQMEVVGKRHYGKKALPHGGGGGRQPTRALFDTLLLWRAWVPLDERGQAMLDVPLNDSLTSFRIVAVATGGLDRFGTGATTIRTTQDLMLFSGLPPVVRQGDRFRAGFTVRNVTDRPLDVRLAPSAAGLDAPLEPRTVALTAGASQVVEWDVAVPPAATVLRWTLEATAGGTTDRLAVLQSVRPAVPARTVQATLVRVEPGGVHEPIARPGDALPDRGGITVLLAPSLVAGLGGVRDWMAGYPYGCLEQRVSRAVALGDPQLWQAVVAALPAHTDGEGLLKFFPTMRGGSEVLSAYVLAIADAAGLTVPESARERITRGLRAFVEGRIRTVEPVRAPDRPLRLLAALNALAPDVAEDDLSRITIEPERWPTPALLDWWSLLQRAPDVADRERRLADAQHLLRARLRLDGTALGFVDEERIAMPWLLSAADVTATRLAWLAARAGVGWRDEAPRLVRGALARQREGRWDGTVSNAWGTVALRAFAAAYERDAVGGRTSVAVSPAGAGATASGQVDWAATPAGGTLELPWPPAAGELTLAHEGSGAPWATLRALAAIPLTAPLAHGLALERSVEPVEVREAGRLHVGDLVRVRLRVDVRQDLVWLVVNDPLPSGAAHVGDGLGGSGALAAEANVAADEDLNAPTFVERSQEAWRAYWETASPGRLEQSYVVRLGQAGVFQMPPARAEALYDPGLYGEAPVAALEVLP